MQLKMGNNVKSEARPPRRLACTCGTVL